MLVIRLLGVVLICACGLLAGIKKAHDVSKRAEIFRLMCLFLDDIYASIRYRQDSAVQLLIKLSDEQKYKPLALQFAQGDTPSWPLTKQKAITEAYYSIKTYISPLEYELFSEALCTVGQDSAEREHEKLEFYKEKLSSIYKQAKEDAVQKKKLYIGVGFFLGACAGIILL